MIGLRSGVQGIRGDERGDPAEPDGVHRRHLRQRRSDRRQIAEITLLAADEIRRFGITPKVALLSHSSFGTSEHPQAKKMQAALALINALDPELEVDGEMHGDAALDEAVRMSALPDLAAQGRGEPADHADASTRRTSRSTC